MKLLKFLLCGLLMALPVLAEEAEDRQTATSLHYVSHELDTRQNKLSAGSNKALTYTNTAGNVEQRTVKSDLTGGTTDTSLPMVNAVNAGLNTKQDDITTIDDHTAVTYTGQTGTIGAKGIYQDTGNYAAQSDNLIDAETFNAALKTGLDSEFICTGYKPGTDLCWLWEIHNNGNNPINIYDPAISPIEQGTIYGSNGQPTGAQDRIRTGYINVSPSTQYAISWSGIAYSIVFEYDDNDNYLGATIAGGISWTSGPRTITTRPTTAKIRIIFATASSGAGERVTPSDLLWLQIEPGANATPRPYTTLVPDGYTPVEYIRFIGEQYVDTGFIVQQSFNPKVELVIKNKNGSAFGAQSEGERSILDFQNQMYSGNGYNRLAYSLPSNDNLIHTLTASYVSTTGDLSISIDGTVVNSGIQTGSFPTGTTYYLGMVHGGSATTTLHGYVYRFSIYQDNSTVLNFIPAIRNSDDKVGMYDTVSGMFFENSGTGTFTAGEPINNIVYIPQNQ